MARNKTVPVVFHEKATKQRKSQNGDIIVSETKPAPINTWGFAYKVNEEHDGIDDSMFNILTAYHHEKSENSVYNGLSYDSGSYDHGFSDGYISAMEYVFECLGIEVNEFWWKAAILKIFKDSYETHKARKDASEKSIAEKKNNNEIVGDAEIYQLGFSSGIVSALTDIALKTK